MRIPFGLLILVLGIGCGRGRVETLSNSDPDRVRSQKHVAVQKGDWPWWGGAGRNFQGGDASLPVDLNEERHLKWKISLDGEGHASPIVIGDRVFIASASLSEKTKSLSCYSMTDGEQVWTEPLHSGGFSKIHSKSSQASATPASDGERIFTAFLVNNAIHVSAVDVEGKILWQKEAGGFVPRHGYGSSPVIYKSLVIVAGDNPTSGFISALDRETGALVWRIARKNESSYSTPVIQEIGGQDQLLISGAKKVHGYDPVTGEVLWQTSGPAKTTANTLATDGQLIFSGGGHPENQLFAIDPAEEKVVWSVKLKSYVPSPVLAGKRLLVPTDNGSLVCFRPADGEELWKVRIGEDVSGSPVVCQDRLYIGGERGTLFVFDLNAKGKRLSRVKLDSRVMSTPVIAGSRLLIRTADSLYCFQQPETQP